uniref:Reverse transcriptase n=1 Tax=Cannabis sativa TaxID=3483 RepID=A0A803Q1P5_CANSA
MRKKKVTRKPVTGSQIEEISTIQEHQDDEQIHVMGGEEELKELGSSNSHIVEMNLDLNDSQRLQRVKFQSGMRSTIGKPIIVDKVTREKSMIKFARVLVEMDITDDPPFVIQFENEKGQIQEQFAEYVWLPIKCNNDKGYGHNMAECRKTSPKGAPWLIVGDFNAIFYYGDRTGYRVVTPNELVDATTWIAQSKLEALKCSGSKFTWSNKQDGKDRVYSKIDHAFINEDWIDSTPNSLAIFQWETSSDHCYCVVKTQQHGNLGIKPFRFYNLWTSHSKFQEVATTNWNKPMTGSGLQCVLRKLLRLKHVLKSFNKKEIGDVEQNYHQAKADYQSALTNAQAAPIDDLA